MTITELAKVIEDKVLFVYESKTIGSKVEVEFKINSQGKINIYDSNTNTLIPTEVIVDLNKLNNETQTNNI
jgi:hypothetical protein